MEKLQKGKYTNSSSCPYYLILFNKYMADLSTVVFDLGNIKCINNR